MSVSMPLRRNSLLCVLYVCVFSCLHIYAQGDDGGACNKDEDDEIEEWISYGGFLIFFLIAGVSFWGLAVVCEDFFVPALNLLCDDLSLPDDVAGATIMAAGNSSPELFACFVSLFITKTALGAGTAIGSAIFNHLCICAGSILYAQDGTLTLNWKILARECLFYFASLMILVWALKGNLAGAFKHAMDHVGGTPSDTCLDVHWYQAFTLVIGYVLYALTCSYYSSIISFLFPEEPSEKDADEDKSKTVEERRSTVIRKTTSGDISQTTALHMVDATADAIDIGKCGTAIPLETYEEPVPLHPGLSFSSQASFSRGTIGNTIGYVHTLAKPSVISPPKDQSQQHPSHVDDDGVLLVPVNTNTTGNPLQQQKGNGIPNTSSLQHTEALRLAQIAASRVGEADDDLESSGSRASYSPDVVPKDATYKCWMYKRSKFYSRLRVLSSQKWQLRYFVLDSDGLRYSRDIAETTGGVQIKTVNIFEATDVYATDLDLFEFVIATKKTKYTFRCPNETDFMGMFSVLAKDIANYRSMGEDERAALAKEADEKLRAMGNEALHEGAEHHLLSTPPDTVGRLIHYFLLPIKVMFFYTIPDISPGVEGATPEDDVKPVYKVTVFMCVVWLAILSYAMNFALEELGAFFGISSSVLGLTFGAAGTSFPNLLSSMIVARQGLGNMAVSNAFGSNVFCIFFGLGFPWFIFILSQGGDPYDGLKDEGIVFSVVILLVVLMAFLLLLGLYKFTMHYWMGITFLSLYGVYLIFAIALG